MSVYTVRRMVVHHHRVSSATVPFHLRAVEAGLVPALALSCLGRCTPPIFPESRVFAGLAKVVTAIPRVVPLPPLSSDQWLVSSC